MRVLLFRFMYPQKTNADYPGERGGFNETLVRVEIVLTVGANDHGNMT